MRRCLLIFLAACAPPLSPLSTARPMDPGSSRWALALGVARQPMKLESVAPALPRFEIGYRRGIDDRLDWGLRVQGTGALFDLKYLFWDGGAVYASFAPGLAGSIAPVAGDDGLMGWNVEVDALAPVLFGGRVGRHSEWTAGLAFIARYQVINVDSPAMDVPSGSGARFIALGGAQAGYLLGIGSRFAVGLEAALFHDLTRTEGVSGELSLVLALRRGR